MKINIDNNDRNIFSKVCNDVRNLIKNGEFESCDTLLKNTISKYPHSPEPHNLYGILFEKIGDHAAAMKHFRAAWALDPTYLPSRFNLNQYSEFYSSKKFAFDESDCPEIKEKRKAEIVYDEKGIGHVVRRKNN